MAERNSTIQQPLIGRDAADVALPSASALAHDAKFIRIEPLGKKWKLILRVLGKQTEIATKKIRWGEQAQRGETVAVLVHSDEICLTKVS